MRHPFKYRAPDRTTSLRSSKVLTMLELGAASRILDFGYLRQPISIAQSPKSNALAVPYCDGASLLLVTHLSMLPILTVTKLRSGTSSAVGPNPRSTRTPTGGASPAPGSPVTLLVRPHATLTLHSQRPVKLSDARSYAMSLGEVTEQPHHELSSFRVRGKIFATVPPSGTHLHLFPSEEVREHAFAMYPEFAEKLLWGGKVAGIRVSLAAARPAAVKSLLLASWRYKAPRSLLGPVMNVPPGIRPTRFSAPHGPRTRRDKSEA